MHSASKHFAFQGENYRQGGPPSGGGNVVVGGGGISDGKPPSRKSSTKKRKPINAKASRDNNGNFFLLTYMTHILKNASDD